MTDTFRAVFWKANIALRNRIAERAFFAAKKSEGMSAGKNIPMVCIVFQEESVLIWIIAQMGAQAADIITRLQILRVEQSSLLAVIRVALLHLRPPALLGRR